MNPTDREPDSRSASAAVNRVAAQLNEAVRLHGSGHLDAAQALYADILRASPMHFDALHLSGVLALQNGAASRAIELIDQAIAINPRSADALSNRASALLALRRLDEALVSLDTAVELRPDSAELHFNRANVLRELGRLAVAVDGYDRALALNPAHVDALCNRGVTLDELGRGEAALESFRTAIRLAPQLAAAHGNCGAALRGLGRLDEALASVDRALALQSDDANWQLQRAHVLQDLGQWRAAAVGYDRAVELAPERGEAHFCRALHRLLIGDYERGWREHEWRWKNERGPNFKDARAFPPPLWTGTEPLAGRTVLLYSEQGLGDSIQFSRYATRVAAAGAIVVLEVPAALEALMRSLAGPSVVLARGTTLPQFDFRCPLLTLPLAFGTRVETISAAPRYLSASADQVALWRTRLGPRTRPRIGLAWSGSPIHPNDQRRSVGLAALLEHLPARFQYISLQKDVRASDREALKSRPDILQFADQLRDFSDTAALCECLDLVISVDTGVAHLSAALGRPTWILLTFNPDWRWLLDREDSPWYPSVRLFRQQRSLDWRGRIRSDFQRARSSQRVKRFAVEAVRQVARWFTAAARGRSAGRRS